MKKLLLILLFPAITFAQSPAKKFDAFSYSTIGATAALSIADCEVSRNRVARGSVELNPVLRGANGSFNRKACYGVNFAWLGATVIAQGFSAPKYRRWFDGLRIGVVGAKVIVLRFQF